MIRSQRSGARCFCHKILQTLVSILRKTRLGVKTYSRKGNTGSAADRIGGRPNYDDFVYVNLFSGCRRGALLGVKLFDSPTAEWLDMLVQPPWLPSSHRSELSMAPCMHAACQCAAILSPPQQWLPCDCSLED